MSKILCSMISKAANRSRRQRQDHVCIGEQFQWNDVEWSEVMFTVGRLVRINQVVRCKVIRETRFNDTLYHF